MTDHHHPHAHPHPQRTDDPEPTTHHQLIGMALRELLIEKGIYTAEEERARIEMLEAASPANGARIVARAWTDPGFKSRLLTEPNPTIESLGLDPFNAIHVVENTETVHNVIVCTLCSCYPRQLLGPQPAWYKSRAYRARVVREPRGVLAEFGTHIPDHVAVRVHDSTAELRYMVLPRRPSGTDGWPEDDLASLVTRDSLIGVTVPAVS